jgi:hypothetical protein
MYTLAPDEKATTVMIYTHNSLARGDLVTKQNARVSIWLRMQAEVYYVHIYKPQVLVFGGPQTKPFVYEEMYLPISQILGFHIVPPTEEPLDYDPNEPNRAMKDVNLLLGCFAIKGKVRISTHTDFANSIEVAHAGWLSVYEVEIVNPLVSQLPAIQTPMMLLNPMHASFGV